MIEINRQGCLLNPLRVAERCRCLNATKEMPLLFLVINFPMTHDTSKSARYFDVSRVMGKFGKQYNKPISTVLYYSHFI